MHELDQMTPNQRLNAFYDRTTNRWIECFCNAGHSIKCQAMYVDDSSREKKLTGE